MSLVVREFDSDATWNETFSDKYQLELIKPRNDLAHNKLFYGNCKKKLHIAKKKQILQCNENCDECSSKYSIEKCEDLRKLMFYYHQLLNDVSKKVDNIIKQV